MPFRHLCFRIRVHPRGLVQQTMMADATLSEDVAVHDDAVDVPRCHPFVLIGARIQAQGLMDALHYLVIW